MKATHFIVGLLAVLALLAPANASWWNESWEQRQQINVSSGSSELTNYTIRLDLNASNTGDAFDWSNDGDDLRFVGSDDTTELDYWIEEDSWDSGGENATLWVEVDTIPTSNAYIYMYYNNSGASSASDVNTTFIFGDDFNRANSDTVGNGWSESTDSGVVDENRIESNRMVCHCTFLGACTARVSHTFTSTNNFRVRSLISAPYADFYSGYPLQLYQTSTLKNYLYVDGNNNLRYKESGGLTTIQSGIKNNDYIVEIIDSNTSDSTVEYVLVDESEELSDTSPHSTGSINKISVNTNDQLASELFMDWFLIAKYDSSDPSPTTYGSEENKTLAPTLTWDWTHSTYR